MRITNRAIDVDLCKDHKCMPNTLVYHSYTPRIDMARQDGKRVKILFDSKEERLEFALLVLDGLDFNDVDRTRSVVNRRLDEHEAKIASHKLLSF